MKAVAKFEKVSYEQFYEAVKGMSSCGIFEGDEKEAKIRKAYDELRLPRRATKGSAGYDFFAPYGFELRYNQEVTIPTGIRCKMDDGIVLSLYPRSGHGFKHRIRLNNTVGIIDSDYYFSDNEGHIFVRMCKTKEDGGTVEIGAGTAFCQGIFTGYMLAEEEDVTQERTGGFGSTGA